MHQKSVRGHQHHGSSLLATVLDCDCLFGLQLEEESVMRDENLAALYRLCEDGAPGASLKGGSPDNPNVDELKC